MRTGTALVAALALAACAGERPMTSAAREGVVRAVNAAVEARFAAMNAHDAEAVGAFYLDGDTFAYASVSDVIVGADAFRTITAPWYSLHNDETFEWTVVHTQVLAPTVATVTIRGSTGATPYLLWTDVMVQDAEGAWKVALEHESWPGAPEPTVHPMTSF